MVRNSARSWELPCTYILDCVSYLPSAGFSGIHLLLFIIVVPYAYSPHHFSQLHTLFDFIHTCIQYWLEYSTSTIQKHAHIYPLGCIYIRCNVCKILTCVLFLFQD